MNKVNVERLFNSEVRSKKRIASGVHHRASRRGYIKGGVKTQSDFMTKKEINKLSGEVKVYNMYDKYNIIENVPSINEIESLPEKERINLFKFLKLTYTNKVLQQHWNISSGSLYNKIYKKYGLYSMKEHKFTKNDKQHVYKSINDVPDIKEIMQMPNFKMIGILTTVREEFTTSVVCEHWGMSKSKLYQLYKKYDIIKSPKQKVNKKIKNDEVVESNHQDNLQTERNNFNIDELVKRLIQDSKNQQIKEETNNTTFSIDFNGEYNKDSIENKLLSISKILEENKNYKISFSLKEM